jgi:menaquinone-specific isochorismate synthase
MFCRSIEIETPLDLTSVCADNGMLFEREGLGYASRGVMATIGEHEITNYLASIKNLTPEFPSPIAFGLVPFLPTEPSTFYVPEFLVSHGSNGLRLVTVLASSESEANSERLEQFLSEVQNTRSPRAGTNTFRVAPLSPVPQYLETVARARDTVQSGALKKVVIARDIEVTADEPINTHSVLHRLKASFATSYRFRVNTLIGASPELLVSVDERVVRSHPLAGTAPRTGDPDTDAQLAAELIASTKNQVEHRLVIDMVRDTLLPHCSYLDWEAEPSIVTVANVQHLGTAIEGALTEPTPHVMSLVKELCPTPALGGYPSAQAIAFIQENEPFKRGYYGGAVGVLDQHGSGTFAVAIRCAEISDDKRHARLFAGGGIVAESDPYAELAETQAKFQAMLSAIVRP